MDAVDPVAREQEGAESGGEREVREGGYVVVGEVDGVLVLQQLLFSDHVLSTVFVPMGRGDSKAKGMKARERKGR